MNAVPAIIHHASAERHRSAAVGPDLAGRLGSYAGLIHAGDSVDPAISKFYGDVSERLRAGGAAQEIHAALTGSGAKVGLATVYRNLQAMAADGEIDMLRTDDGEAVYRRCAADDHHRGAARQQLVALCELADDLIRRVPPALLRHRVLLLLALHEGIRVAQHPDHYTGLSSLVRSASRRVTRWLALRCRRGRARAGRGAGREAPHWGNQSSRNSLMARIAL